MRLLIITQKVDIGDPILGFFHRWIIEFAKHFERVTVICLGEGAHELPANVMVLPLGEKSTFQGQQSTIHEARLERRKGRRANYAWKFYKYIWNERKNYDVVFVHMNPIYVVLGGFLWKLLRKRVNLWYVHRSVDIKLRMATLFTDTIYTATKESCLLRSDKICIVGHGIDTERYAAIIRPSRIAEDPIRIVHVGRVTRIKNCDTLISAAGLLKESWNKVFEIIFIGNPMTSADHEYKKILEEHVKRLDLLDTVRFIGSVPNKDIDVQYAQTDASVNLAPTGGMDKAVLESLASGVPAFFSNEAFLDIFKPYENIFHVVYKDALMLADKIKLYFSRTDTAVIEARLRTRIIEQFSVSALISRISLNIHDAGR